MKIGRGSPNRHDLNRLRQPVPEGRSQLFGPMRPNRVEMKYLAIRMDARISPPAPVNPRRSAEDIGKSAFNDILDRGTFGLALPSRKSAPVVGADALPPFQVSPSSPSAPGI